jgi:predicted NACHT family NTPase
VAYEHSEGWGAASTKIVISGGFGAGKTTFVGAVAESCRCAPRRGSPARLRGWTPVTSHPVSYMCTAGRPTAKRVTHGSCVSTSSNRPITR